MTIRSEIQERLANNLTLVRNVFGASEFSAIKPNLIVVPVVFVVRRDKSAGTNTMNVEVLHRVRQVFSIIIITKNLADARGANSADENEAIQDEIQKYLLGWPPESADETLEYVGGSIAAIGNSMISWDERYSTNTFVRSV